MARPAEPRTTIRWRRRRFVGSGRVNNRNCLAYPLPFRWSHTPLSFLSTVPATFFSAYWTHSTYQALEIFVVVFLTDDLGVPIMPIFQTV